MNLNVEAVLVSGDDPSTRALLVSLLESMGLLAVARESGRVTSDFLKEQKPSLAVLDTNFTPDEGQAMISSLRLQGVETAFVIITDRTQWSASNINDKSMWFLSKPIAPAEFKAFVGAVMGWPNYS